MDAKSGKLRSLSTLLFLCAVAISSNSRVFVAAQFEDTSLNFCEIPCVQKVYDQYCGGARCTTGASDYGQIFALCTDTCAAAVIGEVMMLCLTTTVPDRDDWANVQNGVLEEIVSFCSGYEIAVDENVKPLKRKDTDKELRNTLFDTPEDEKKESKEGKGKSERKEEKGGKKSRKAKLVEAEKGESQKQRKREKVAAESDVDTSKGAADLGTPSVSYSNAVCYL